MLILQHTVWVHFIKSIQEALDRGVCALGIFFLVTKAYKVINHNILLAKLDVCYIRGIKKLVVHIIFGPQLTGCWNKPKWSLKPYMKCIQFSYQGNETWSTARHNFLASFVFTIYRWTAVSMGNTFQDLPRIIPNATYDVI